MNNVVVLKFPRSAIPAESRTGAESQTSTVIKAPVRPPCSACDGVGKTYGFGTNNPSERGSWAECELCRGTGLGVEPPCGSHCYCWQPLDDAHGLCVKDDDMQPLRAGEDYSAWREDLK